MFTILFNSNLYLQTQIGKETNSGLIQSSLGSSCPKLRHFLDSSLSLTPHPATAHSIGSTSTVPSSSLHLYCFSPGPPSCSSITPGAWNLASWIHSGPLQCRSHLAFRVTFEKQKSEDITPLGKILHESLTPIPAPGYSCPPLPACLSALSGHQHHSCLGLPTLPGCSSPTSLCLFRSQIKCYPHIFYHPLRENSTTLSHVKENQGGPCMRENLKLYWLTQDQNVFLFDVKAWK